jgi:hypothetical protein
MENLPARPSPMCLTGPSLNQKAEIARSILVRPITATAALKSAKKLVGSYANLRPADPEEFGQCIAEVLGQYPAGVVEECVDPRIGVAKKVEFLSIKSLTEWLDNRLVFYQSLASYMPKPQRSQSETVEISAEQREQMALAMKGLSRAIDRREHRIEDMSLEQIVELGRE